MSRGSVAQLSLLTQRDRQLVDEFIESLGVLSQRRIEKYHAYLGKIGRELGKPFEEVTRHDLQEYIKMVAVSKFTESTKRDIRLISKKFFRWLRNEEFVSGIRVGTVKPTVAPEDVLEDSELSALRRAAAHPRDRALVETLYEAALRPHEFLGLMKSDVVFDEYGAKIHVRKGKTGPRTVRVINAAPLLATWIENHISREEDAPLWVDISHGKNGGALKWTGLTKVLDRLRYKAELSKPVTAYLFRHTRLTQLASWMTDAQLCAFAGWQPGSDMPRMYVHLSRRDVDEALLRSYGLKKSDEGKTSPSNKVCKMRDSMRSSGRNMFKVWYGSHTSGSREKGR